MLRLNSVFRGETLSRRNATLFFLALLTASFLMTSDGFGGSKRRSWQPVQWYWQGIASYQYVHSFRNIVVSSFTNQYDFTWYQRLIGQFIFHQQQLGIRGIHIADWYRTEITIASNEDVPPIILAAAIANQGNSPTRPFDIDLLERVQLWIGQTFDWHGRFGMDVWNDKFESPSIGIAQIMPAECLGHNPWSLFDDKTSISLMLAKLQSASQAALKMPIAANDWFALTLLGNNFGAVSVSDYQEYLKRYSDAQTSMKQFLKSAPDEKKQLARMLAYVQFLANHEGWSLPKNIDMDYLWSLVE